MAEHDLDLKIRQPDILEKFDLNLNRPIADSGGRFWIRIFARRCLKPR